MTFSFSPLSRCLMSWVHWFAFICSGFSRGKWWYFCQAVTLCWVKSFTSIIWFSHRISLMRYTIIYLIFTGGQSKLLLSPQVVSVGTLEIVGWAQSNCLNMVFGLCYTFFDVLNLFVLISRKSCRLPHQFMGQKILWPSAEINGTPFFPQGSVCLCRGWVRSSWVTWMITLYQGSMVLGLPIWWKGQRQAARIFPGKHLPFFFIGWNLDRADALYSLGTSCVPRSGWT